ncbi:MULTISPECIES: glycine zipper 2TM domain-containing protein [unclassified Bartonella]|uniref:glycine zipper 2TM domain-containing protein n=1 Tax=unclassified Bartonella TaxID=2645622 RepID=UPI0035CF1F24
MGSSSSSHDSHRNSHSTTACGIKDYYHAAQTEKIEVGLLGGVAGALYGGFAGSRVGGVWGTVTGAVAGGYAGYKMGRDAGLIIGPMKKFQECGHRVDIF